MQVSIWSTFSSNHSSRFTVVGVFQTPEQAGQAAGVFTSLLQSVVAWHNQTENAEAPEDSEPEPTPPELALAKQLDIEWGPLSLDWLWISDAEHESVKVVDSLVFLDGTESNLGAHPANAVIQRIGGQALVDGYRDAEGKEITSLVLDLSCTAPDQATAEKIESTTDAYLLKTQDRQGPIFQTPWEGFMGKMAYSDFRGRVRRKGLSLRFVGEFFAIGDGFPAMLGYLRAKGCTDIQYQFTEKNFYEEE